MKKILKYIPHAFAIILAIIVVLGFFNQRTLRNDMEKYRAAMLKYSDMYSTAKGETVKMAEEFSKLELKNKELNKEIKKQGEKIQSLIDLNANIKDSVANIITTPDTVYIDNNGSMPIRRFALSQGNFTLKGYFEIRLPYRITFDEIKAEIALEIAMTQDRDLIWRSYIISTDPSFVVNNIQTSIKPYKPGFWDKLKFGAGLYASSNRVGGIAGIYYGNLGINLLLDNNGAAVGAQYLFGVRK